MQIPAWPGLTSLLTRRNILQMVPGFTAASIASSVFDIAPVFAATPAPVVETTYGKVKGVFKNGIYSFKGMSYGASTEGKYRFQPASKPVPWAGVREATHVGSACPQLPHGFNADINEMIRTGTYERSPHYGEDCLVLNVWTPAASNSTKRAVMFYCHGGSYIGGSGGGSWFDRTNLAKDGDVVVVTINHRVNLFGFLYLAEFGDSRYADSGNVSMLDIVMALEWVRDNIGAFGGDSGNVTIFGESGGGSKVSVLLAMPAAKGLFHKAIVQSGSALRGRTKEAALKHTEAVLGKLQIKRNELEKLHALPFSQLVDASSAGAYGPVVDGRALPDHPFDPVAPRFSANIPMIIGTTQQETALLIGDTDPSVYTLSERDLHARLAKTLGGPPDKLIELYRKSRPEATPSDLFFDITTDLGTHRNALTQAERKVKQDLAPVYMYLFTWQSRGYGGKYKALHASDVAFAFNNVMNAHTLTNDEPKAFDLAKNMSRAWLAFAKKGNPNHGGLPKWNTYSLNERATMIFGDQCKAVNDPSAEERIAVQNNT